MFFPVSSKYNVCDVRRILALDLLRALAVFLVLGHHAAWRFRPESADIIGQILKGGGWIGVDIFFAISGFMITRIIVRDQTNVYGFFVRRFYRIVPIFLVAVSVFIALTLITGKDIEKLWLIWSPALFLNGWTIPFYGYGAIPYTITWSLSVEETAYIFLGIACFFSTNILRWMLIGFLVVAPFVRFIVVASAMFPLMDLYFFVPARLDAIALGGLGALGVFTVATRFKVVQWFAGSTVLVLIWSFQFIGITNPIMPLFGYLVFGFSVAILVTALANERPDSSSNLSLFLSHPVPNFVIRCIAEFGKLSYFVYLFHIFVLEGLLLVQRFVPRLSFSFWESVFLTIIIIFLMASISWHYFEYPLIKYGRRITVVK